MGKQRIKKLSYELIEEDSPLGQKMYRMMVTLIAEYHDDLKEARIALAWNTSWKPDPDGRVTLGKLKKATDLDRELHRWDFVMVLRKEFWEHPDVTDDKREALMDHELCHGRLKLDKNLDPVTDAKGRKVYRTRKHDIEEFREVVWRHGYWKYELETFAEAVLKHQKPLPFGKTEKDNGEEKPAPPAA